MYKKKKRASAEVWPNNSKQKTRCCVLEEWTRYRQGQEKSSTQKLFTHKPKSAGRNPCRCSFGCAGHNSFLDFVRLTEYNIPTNDMEVCYVWIYDGTGSRNKMEYFRTKNTDTMFWKQDWGHCAFKQSVAHTKRCEEADR